MTLDAETETRCTLCRCVKYEVRGYLLCPHCDSPCGRATRFTPCPLCQKVDKHEGGGA